jgi:hypothetical protein
MSEVQTTATVKLSATEKLTNKIAALFKLVTDKTAEYHAAVAELEAITRVANVGAGDTVKATVGRGEKAQHLEGVVLGVVEDEAKGKLVKIQTGSGFDTMTFVLKAGEITEVTPKAAEPSALAVAMGTEAAGVSEAPAVDQDQADVDAYLSQPQVAIA